MLLPLGLVACDGEINEDTPPNDVPAHVDLFACGVQLTCPAYCIHLSIADCSSGGPETLGCAGELWLEGGSGALEVHDRPGPGNWMGDKLTLFLGDGKALVQNRTRSCLDAPCETIPWELGAHELCDVATPPATCQPDNCSELPVLENCAPLETDWSCGEVATAMSPMP
ncbi:hypothetical protein [Polyangium fumosum]|uniref:Uncharacterized protein n=1 Tax=Polyangium fumosum TaxID=889272 RepID=A0A4U1IY10_9BACT|nr:hypothetical protein [Polyangium fumosum]TKC99441.1 hypothetical protein E8A74_37570 [Polyangium fumosum]